MIKRIFKTNDGKTYRVIRTVSTGKSRWDTIDHVLSESTGVTRALPRKKTLVLMNS